MRLHIAQDFSLPLDAVAEISGIPGKRRSDKTISMPPDMVRARQKAIEDAVKELDAIDRLDKRKLPL